ncbi:hypothetical protein NL676_029713 [Syzygium grande]|nr:hypothetical protein NL676_029713 [Syzygium grande]
MSRSSSRLQHREDDVSGVPRSSSGSSSICSCSDLLSLSHVPGVVRRELDDLLPSVTSRFFFTGPRREAAPATWFHVARRTGTSRWSRPLQVFRP